MKELREEDGAVTVAENEPAFNTNYQMIVEDLNEKKCACQIWGGRGFNVNTLTRCSSS